MRSKYIPWKVNEEIKAESLRVIDSEAKQVGVLTRDEALKKAKELGLDLIEVVAIAKPPVAKLMNLGKFLYQEEKKKKIEAKKVKGGEVKEVRLSPFIAENDYNTRLKRLREFLEDKNKAKVVVVFKGRQMNSKSFGYSLLGKVLDNLGRDRINVDMEPKFMGRHLIMIISPTNKFKKEGKKDETKDEN